MPLFQLFKICFADFTVCNIYFQIFKLFLIIIAGKIDHVVISVVRGGAAGRNINLSNFRV